MTHPLPAYFGTCYLNSTPVTNNPLVAYSLIFTAVALPILLGAEYLFTKQTVLFGFQSTIIYGLWLLYLTSGPFPNLIGGSQAYLNGIQIIQLEQGLSLPSSIYISSSSRSISSNKSADSSLSSSKSGITAISSRSKSSSSSI